MSSNSYQHELEQAAGLDVEAMFERELRRLEEAYFDAEMVKRKALTKAQRRRVPGPSYEDRLRARWSKR
jgi:hypothetical protein